MMFDGSQVLAVHKDRVMTLVGLWDGGTRTASSWLDGAV